MDVNEKKENQYLPPAGNRTLRLPAHSLWSIPVCSPSSNPLHHKMATICYDECM